MGGRHGLREAGPRFLFLKLPSFGSLDTREPRKTLLEACSPSSWLMDHDPVRRPSLSIADFAFCGMLGEGQFGRVMMARNTRTQDIVAGSYTTTALTARPSLQGLS